MEKKRKGAVAILALFTVLTVGTTMLLPAEVSAASRPAKVKSLKAGKRLSDLPCDEKKREI